MKIYEANIRLLSLENIYNRDKTRDLSIFFNHPLHQLCVVVELKIGIKVDEIDEADKVDEIDDVVNSNIRSR